jgi:hypothetical protein
MCQCQEVKAPLLRGYLFGTANGKGIAQADVFIAGMMQATMGRLVWRQRASSFARREGWREGIVKWSREDPNLLNDRPRGEMASCRPGEPTALKTSLTHPYSLGRVRDPKLAMRASSNSVATSLPVQSVTHG